MSAILVTGGIGLIGSLVSRKLIEMGKEVVVFDLRKDMTFVKDIEGRLDFVEGDLTDLPKIIHTIRHYNIERIIHMASAPQTLTETNLMMGFKIQAEGTMNILEASRLLDIHRCVCISSQSVYALPEGKHAHPLYKPITEDWPKAPRHAYGASKLYMEHMGIRYHQVHGLDYVGIRFATTYGPGKALRWPSVAIQSHIIESAMTGTSYKVSQGGDQVDDMIYHKDAAQGVVNACFAENLSHRIFHLGTGQGVTLKDMVKVLEDVYGDIDVKIGPGLDYMGTGKFYGVYDITRAREELGYDPQFTLESGIRDYIETMGRLKVV